MTARIAFHAPLKPPDHKNPSGDRRFARLLIEALSAGGFSVDVPSSLRTRNPDGSTTRQQEIEEMASHETSRLCAALSADPPDLWFTYHNYYKAPDLIGPAVSRHLKIPYVLAEASHAPQRAQGEWARGSALADAATVRADLILQPNPKDMAGVEALGPGDRQLALKPFLDVKEQAAQTVDRDLHRDRFARRFNLPRDAAWAVATGMMRRDSKRDSFLLLADVADRIPRDRWQLILVGDGPARPDIEAAFGKQSNVRFAGLLGPDDIRSLNAASDLFIWPALKEAFGMALLEAQAAGLPAIVGDRPGTRAIMQNGQTGILTPEGDAPSMASAVRALIDDPDRRRRMGRAAHDHVLANHDIAAAATFLKQKLDQLIETGRRQ